MTNRLQWMIIDLDDTLLDFDAAARRSLETTYREFGVAVNESNIVAYREINKWCWQDFENGAINIADLKRLRFEKLVERLQLSVSAIAMNRLYLQLLGQQVDEIKGARDFLHWASGEFSLVLATNGFADVQWPRIRAAELNRFFKHIVISEEIGARKPQRAFFDHAFGKMGNPKPEEVIIVGDGLTSDIAGGINYGIFTCWFNPKGKALDGSLEPHVTVQQLAEVKNIL